MRKLLLNNLSFAIAIAFATPVRADEGPKTEPTRIEVAADKTPFQKEAVFADGDCYVVVMPNGKEVALWAEKNRFPIGEQVTKSGLHCRWGQRPFELERPNGGYIKQGAVITSTRQKKSEHELFIGEWQLSYIEDLASTPELKVTVVIKKRDEPK